MITLAVDASTYVGSVAVFDGDRLVSEQTAAMRGRDSERLLPAIDATLRAASIDRRQVDRVICGAGPGSFTSLRIAASAAKGLAVGWGRPLYVVPSLALVVAAHAPPDGDGQRYLVALDALRGESYVSTCLVERTVRVEGGVRLVPTSEVEALAAASGLRVVGPASDGEWLPHARGALRIADIEGPVDVAGWEPSYGRPAEAQARWESTHGRALPT